MDESGKRMYQVDIVAIIMVIVHVVEVIDNKVNQIRN
jgi:hypothetical protein